MGRSNSSRFTGYVRPAAQVVEIVAFIALGCASASAVDVRLRWSPVANAAGYRVYVRTAGQQYALGYSVGLPPLVSGAVEHIATNVLAGVTNYFAVTSYDAQGRLSPFSNELSVFTGTPAVGTSTAVPTATPRPATSTPTRAGGGPVATSTRTRTPTRTSTPSPTATRVPSNAIGLTSVGSSLDSKDSNFLNGSKVFATSGGTIRWISVYVGDVDSNAGNRSFQLAIYNDNGGRPGTLVARTSSGTLVTNRWNTLSINASVQANRSYWLMYNTNGRSAGVNNMRYNTGATGQGVYSASGVGFGTWPTTFPTSVTTSAVYSLFATY